MSNSTFHDASVLGVEYQDQPRLLVFKIRFSNKEIKRIVFNNVYDFNLDSFSSQNVLFDIVQHGKNEGDFIELLKECPGLSAKAIEHIKTSGYHLYIFESSVGMTGYVIATDFNE